MTGRYLTLFLALSVSLFSSLSGTVLAQDAELVAQYNRKTDTLAIPAGSGSLTRLLRQISAQSGVEIKIDPQEEREVDGDISERPLVDALTTLAKQYRLNYVMGHQRDDTGADQLVSFAILKEGEMSAAGLPPLIDINAEAVSQLRDANKHKQHTTMKAYQRWESRFSQLPPEVRARIQENAMKNIERAAEREAKSAERRAMSEAKRNEKLARQQKAMETLKETNPERHALKQQRRQELEKKALEEAERRREANEALRAQQ